LAMPNINVRHFVSCADERIRLRVETQHDSFRWPGNKTQTHFANNTKRFPLLVSVSRKKEIEVLVVEQIIYNVA
jgi:catalase